MPSNSLFRTFNRTVRLILILNLILSFVPLPSLHSLGRSSGVGVAHAAPFVIASKRDVLTVDNDNDGVADPGDTIRYTVVVTNTGSSGATNVDFIDTIDANTTLVDLTGNDYRTTPIARNDVYAAIGNVGITVPAGSGILVNDNDPDGTTPTLAIVSTLAGGTANGGAFSIGADGSFAYLPPPGFEGTDTFTYVVQDSDGNQDPAVVFITVTGVIWFIDNTVGSGGNGTLFNPFDSLSDHNLNTIDDNGDTIFIYSGSGSYPGGITLQAGQKLVGQGAGASLASIAGITVPTHGNTLPTTGGSRPVITNGGGSGITLGSNNLLRGLNVGDTSTLVGAGLSGVSVGNLAIVEMSITGQGKAIDINGGGVLDVSLDTVAVTASTNGGVSLQNAGGTTSIGTLSLATTDGTAFLASNAGTVNVNSAGSSTATVNSSGGPGINVSNSTLNATFTGVTVANSSGIGVRLDTNGGSTNITGTGNTVSTTGGTAVHVSNSAIGGSGITFLSVSASNADTGITLNNTGSGDFTVTGTGTTDGSGGTLGNLNDHGVELINAQDVSLSNMNLTNAATTQEVAPNTATCTNLSNGTNLGCNAPVHMVNATNVSLTNLTINGSVQHGVNGNNVNGLSISNTDVSNIGNQTKENGMHFINLLGTVNFNNVSVVGSNTRNVLIENNSGTANVTVANSTFNTAGSEVGLDFLGLGTANITFSVTDSSFSDNNSVQLKALAEDNSTIDATITGNDFDGNPAVTGNTGVDLVAVDSGTLTFDVIGTLGNPQTFQPFRGQVINVFASGGGTATGRVNGNTVLGSAFGAGVRAVAQVTDFNGFNPRITIEIAGNTISGVQGGGLAGIHIEARDGTNGLTGVATIDATVTDNDVTTNGADAAIQVYLEDLNGTANRVCINATGNATEANGGVFGETDFFFGNDAITGSNSGVAQMQGFATSVSNTWFNVNGNTSTTTPTPFADSLGPIGGGTCGTVASLSPSGNGTMVVESDDAPLSVAAVGETTLNAASARVLLSAADLVESFVARFGDATSRLVATEFETAPVVASAPSTSRRSPGLAKPALAPHASGETIVLDLGDLNPGQVVVITFDVTIDNPQNPATNSQVCNQGLFNGNNFADVLTDDPAVGGVSDPTCTAIEVSRVDLQVRKVDNGFEAKPGDTIQYTINFTNTGTNMAYGVVLTDTVPAGTTFNAGASTAGWNCPSADAGTVCTLPVGTIGPNFASGSASFVVYVLDPIHSCFYFIINGVAIGDDGAGGPDQNPADNFSVAITPVDARSDLQVRKIDNGFEAEPGDTIQYTISFTNTGTNTAYGVVLTDTVPAGTTFNAGASTAGWNCPSADAGTVCTLPVGTIGPNFASGSASFVVDVLDPLHSSFDFIINGVAIGDDGAGGPDQNPADNFSVAITPVDARSDLQVRKIDNGFEAEPGDTIQYTISFTNTGTNTAYGVVLTDTVPDGTTFNAGASTAGWNCPSVDAGTVCTLPVGTIGPNFAGGSASFVVDAVSPASAMQTFIVNGVAIGDDGAGGPDQNPADNFSVAITPVDAAPDLQVSKDDGVGFVSPGGTIQYTIVYTNAGNRDTDSTIISETVPANTTFDFSNNPDGFDCSPSTGEAGANCTVNVGTVPGNGGGGSVTFSVIVDNPLTPGVTETTNVVDIYGIAATPDANPADNSAQHTTTLNAPPEISGVSPVEQTVQYSDLIATVIISATDPGPDDLTLSAGSLPDNLSLSTASCSAATGGGKECTWTLSGQMLEAAGTYNIEVTASDGSLTSDPATITIVVEREDAAVAFDDANPVSVLVASDGGDSEPFTLAVDVTEFDDPDDVSGDTNLAGTISLANVTLTLVPVGPGGSESPTSCTTSTGPGLIDPDSPFDYDVLTVSCDFDAVPVNTYVVQVGIGGDYYTGAGEDVLVVYDPSLGFTTGGGWFYWPGTQDRTNFGYNMKYNKQGKKVKGNLLLIRHLPDGSIYRVKSNALDGLALGDEGSFGWATFSGKSTYLEPGWLEPVGNHTFVVYVEDHGEPGAGADQFWIEVQDKDGNIVSLSMDRPASGNSELLQGGNIVVPHGGGGGRGRR